MSKSRQYGERPEQMDPLSWVAPYAGAALRLLPAETAHSLTLRSLAAGFGPSYGALADPSLVTQLWGRRFPTPIGLAAGFDKNAEAVDALLALGPGFVEIGAITPRPQPGNPKPRVFRLVEDQAIINRLGFNNAGVQAAHRNLQARHAVGGVVGVNIGANKNSVDRIADYETVLRDLWGLCDFYTLNVSSPNTERLRDLQGKEALGELLLRLVRTRDGLAAESGVNAPLLVKIAPDLTDREVEDVAEVALFAGVDGVVATNTTTERPSGLHGRAARQQGGLSGPPLFERSTSVLRRLAARTEGRMPLVGVGGVSTGEQAYDKIKAGASLVQLYTGLVYRGPRVFRDVAEELSALLRRDGFAHVEQAVGQEVAPNR